MTAKKWATANDVSDITGIDVDERAVRRAVSTLETITGLIEAVDRPDITDRDRHWLKLMVAYQAAFMADNPDLFARADVTSASQDGESANFRNVDSHLFSPLARKAYRRLSWRSLRLLATSGGPARIPSSRTDVASEAFDDHLPWEKL